MEMVRIFDTTLRDGEQAPGFSMNTAEKLRLARRLESLGVDVIEAGFPIASQGRFRGGARGGAGESRHSTVAGLARARREDIDAALGALERAARPRVHVFLATSDLHLKHKLRISRAEALDSIGKMVAFAQGALPGGGVFRRGFQPQRYRISGAGVCDCGGSGRDDPERAGHGWVRDAGGVRRDVSHAAGEGWATGREWCGARIATTIWGWRWRIRWRRWRLGRGRWSARSTASASARGTRRWRRLPWRWRCGRTVIRPRRGCS